MNITKTNNVNFSGKNEVIYGLKKAANESRKIGLNTIQGYGPHPIIKDHEIYNSKGALKAYTDMIVNDSQFELGIKKATTDPLINNELKDTLKPIKYPSGEYKVQGFFIDNITQALEKSGQTISENVNRFFESIKL